MHATTATDHEKCGHSRGIVAKPRALGSDESLITDAFTYSARVRCASGERKLMDDMMRDEGYAFTAGVLRYIKLQHKSYSNMSRSNQ